MLDFLHRVSRWEPISGKKVMDLPGAKIRQWLENNQPTWSITKQNV